jgi:HAD superfamily hydrolase (TIGR01509 family)
MTVRTGRRPIASAGATLKRAGASLRAGAPLCYLCSVHPSVPSASDADVPRGLAAVLLDYGGTLDGDALHWLDHFTRLYAEAGLRPAPADLRRAFYAADEALATLPGIRGYGLDPMVETHVRLQLAGLGIDDAALGRRLAAAFAADTRRAWDRNRPLLRRLARRFRLGVVSNSYGNMPVLLAEAGLGDFALVLDSALVGIRKPDPALYRLAARRLGLAPEAILHVGDSWERDVVAARAAGLRAAWLAPAGAPTPAAPAPVWRLASLLELEALLR